MKRREKKVVKFNAENERIKRRYLEWEKEANGKSEKTINNVINSIYLLEKFTGFEDFKKINKKSILGFKKELKKKINKGTNLPVSKKYLLHTVRDLMNFFKWLSRENGYRQKINLSDIEYFNLTDKEVQIARSKKTKRVPTLEQLKRVIENMPEDTEVQKRDRALVAFIVLTGIRVNAARSVQLKHVHLEDGFLEQDPNEIDTKFSKGIISYFFPVGDIFRNVFLDWVNYLKEEKHFGYDMPLFPKAKLELDEYDQFKRESLDIVPLQSTTPIRDIFKRAFETAGIPYYNPHSIRDTLIRLGYKVCKTPEHFKSWSQNIGHDHMLTTFTSYGRIDPHKQGEIIKSLGKKDEEVLDTEKALSKIVEKEMRRYFGSALPEEIAKLAKEKDT